MSIFKTHPELTLDDGNVEGLYRIQTVSGRVIFAGHFDDRQDAERFVSCWNACRKIAFPAAHIEASEEYGKRTEQLRKDAWATAVSLQTEVDQLRASMPENAE
ncbi:hypothetical protein J2X76_003643 [Neorhizobium sp. 2083]|uniref:hypothetical protein n=1 Tax=Neorhizobium sp. 2083 TaxID=2817762 RepID=UPI00285CEB3C|nr:hypothetical protein [Neorhizobium sp. 2083]MDR6818466.1 hypothetical protein [Neorhizobium sp. 2083]